MASAGEPPGVRLPEPTVLAHYDGGQVTTRHLDSWNRYHRRATAGGSPTEARPPTDRETLETISVQLYLEQMAVRRGLDRQAEARMAIWWYEVSQLEIELRRWLASRIELPAATLQAAFEEQKSRFDRPRRVRLRNLYKAWPDASDEHRHLVRQNVESLRRQVLSGADFGELARRESESQSRWQDGLIGWIKPGQLADTLEQAAMELDAGDVSEVLESTGGLTLLYCEEVAAAQTADPQEVRAKLRRRLRRAELVEQLAQLRRAAMNQARIALHQLDGQDPAAVVIVFADGDTLDAEESRALLRLGGKSTAAPEEEIRGALEEIIYRRAAAQLARREGLGEDLDLQARLEWNRRAILVAREARDQLAERFEPLEEAQLEVYFERHRQRYRQPATYQLGLIRKLASREVIRQTYTEMDALAGAIATGEARFEEIARSHSDLPSAQRGGRTAWLPADQISALGPTVSRAFHALSQGQTSDLIQQSEGLRGDSSLWIVRWIGTRQERDRTFVEARSQVENDLGNEQVQELQRQLHLEILQRLDLRLGNESATP